MHSKFIRIKPQKITLGSYRKEACMVGDNEAISPTDHPVVGKMRKG